MFQKTLKLNLNRLNVTLKIRQTIIKLFLDYPSEVPKLPPVPMTAGDMTADSRNDLILDDSEDTLRSAAGGVETSVEMDNSTDVEMGDS